MASLSASLIFIYAVGAIISPVLAGYLIEVFGAESMFVCAALHIVLLCFTDFTSSGSPGYSAKIRIPIHTKNVIIHRKTISSLNAESNQSEL